MNTAALDPGATIAAAVTELYDELRALVDRGPTDDPGLLDELGRLTGRIRSRITRARKRAATLRPEGGMSAGGETCVTENVTQPAGASVARKATQTSVQENRTQTPGTSMVENTMRPEEPDATRSWEAQARGLDLHDTGPGAAGQLPAKQAEPAGQHPGQPSRAVPAAVPPASPRVTVPIGPPSVPRSSTQGVGNGEQAPAALLPRWLLLVVFVLAVVVSAAVSASGGNLLVLCGGVVGIAAGVAGLVAFRSRHQGKEQWKET